jgi:hypothetical protein
MASPSRSVQLQRDALQEATTELRTIVGCQPSAPTGAEQLEEPIGRRRRPAITATSSHLTRRAAMGSTGLVARGHRA